MLEITAAIAAALLIAREFLALERGALHTWTRRVGWAAIPFLLAFALLFAMRVAGYLADTAARNS